MIVRMFILFLFIVISYSVMTHRYRLVKLCVSILVFVFSIIIYNHYDSRYGMGYIGLFY